MSEYADSAGTAKTEDEVRAAARATLQEMGITEVIDMLFEEWVTVDAIPNELTFCPCHSLWYEDCDAYRRT